MKVLMLLSNPFMVDPRVYKEAKALTDAGHNVTVIVWDRKHEYESESIVEGIRIVRIHNRGFMKCLLHDLFRNPLWWRKAFKTGLKLYDSGFRFDVVHCHDLDTLQAGVWLKKKLGIKLIYDAHEIFGHMVSRTMPKVVAYFAFKMEKALVKYVDHVVTAEETYVTYFKSICCNSITPILNCKDLVNKTYQTSKNKVFTIVYIGVLNRSRFFPECLDVIGDIDDVKFIIAGKKENMYEEIKKLSKHYENIEFLGSIPFNKVIPTTAKANLILCMIYPNDINNKIASANKQFEAMVCGRPIICTKGTRSGDITENEKCGIVVDYTKEGLRKAIIKLRDSPDLSENLGRNALRAAITKYNWKNEERKLLKIYETLKGSI